MLQSLPEIITQRLAGLGIPEQELSCWQGVSSLEPAAYAALSEYLMAAPGEEIAILHNTVREKARLLGVGSAISYADLVAEEKKYVFGDADA